MIKISLSILLSLLLLLPGNPAKASLATASPGDNLDIVGGSVTDIKNYPWMVSLQKSEISSTYDAHFCAGSLVSSRWILTAAHCVYYKTASQIKVLAGFTALSTATSSDRLDIDTVLVNPSFNPFTLDHDTALLRLTKHYELDKYLGIERRANIDGLSATIIGWGYPSERYTQLSDKLKAATVGIVSNNTCQGAYNYYNFKILPSMLCAIGNEVDACGGDSGGPLLTVYNKATVSTGVTSFGVGCSRDHMYGGYARTSSAYPWLAATSSLSSKFTSGLIFSSATFSSLNVRICSSNLAGRNVYLQMYRLATATTPQQLVNTYRAARPDAGCIDFYNIDGDETMLENAEYYIIASLYPLNPYEAKKMQKECYLISNNTRLCSYTKNAPLTIRPLPLPTLPPPGFEPPSSLM